MNTALEPPVKKEVEETHRLDAKRIGEIIIKFQKAMLGAFIILALMFAGTAYWQYDVSEKSRESVYVITSGGTFRAEVRKGGDDRHEVEVKSQAKAWINYTLAYDFESYDSQVKKALSMMDETQGIALEQYLATTKIKKTLEQLRTKSVVEISKIKLLPKSESDLGKPVYAIEIFGTQVLKATLDDKEKNIPVPFGYRLKMESITRTMPNPYGLIVTSFEPLKVKIDNQTSESNTSTTSSVDAQKDIKNTEQ